MEVHYKREMKHNYLIVEPDAGDRPGYEARMLLNNAVDGLLRFHIKYMDERQSYYYDITSMQPLSRILQNRFIDRGEICQLLIQIHVALRRMEEYLLCEDGILLEPDYIYVEPEGFRTGLCLVPGMTGSFPERLNRLLQYLMKKVDHRDKESVVLAYGLYQESLKENFSIEDIMKLVQREGKAVETEAGNGSAVSGEQRQELWGGGNGQAFGGAPDFEAGAEGDERRSREIETDRKPVDGAGGKRGKAEDGGGNGGGGLAAIMGLALKQLAAVCLVGVGGPALTWFMRGPSAVRRYLLLWLVIPAAALALTVTGDIAYVMLRGKIKKREGQGWSEEPPRRWEIPEEELEPAELKGEPEPAKEEAFQTTLLAGCAEDGVTRRLESREEKAEDILIPYFPFIIGKHEELVDYVLNRSTVSRLHVRIDREGEKYRVTDLNSTNGTMVGARFLEANETVEICVGDEICIADLRFIFR